MSRARALTEDCAIHFYDIATTLLIIFLALRLGVRPLLILAAIVLPELIGMALHDYSIFTTHDHRRTSLAAFLCGNGAFFTITVVSVLALIALAQVWRTASLSRAVWAWGLVLTGSQAIELALALSLHGLMSTRQLPADCIGMVFSAAAAILLGRALLRRSQAPSLADSR